MTAKMNRIVAFTAAMILFIINLIPLISVSANETGTITAVIKNEHGTKPVSGIDVNICMIAFTDSDGVFKPADDFKDSGIPLDKLIGSGISEHAKTIYDYIIKNKIPFETKKTGRDGTSTFSDFKKGIYIIFGSKGQAVRFNPYIIFMPSKVNGINVYDITSTPKTTDKSDGGGEIDTSQKHIKVKKIWNDNNNKAGKRPKNITVFLLRNNSVYEKAVFSEAAGYQKTFTGLPVSGKYSVKEADVPEYTAEYSGNEKSGFTITNTYKDTVDIPVSPDSAHISVIKKWDDDNNAKGKRPKAITVQLIKGDEVAKTAVLNEDNGWHFTFGNLSEKDKYTVKEITPSEYSASYSGNSKEGFVITNKYTEGITNPGDIPTPDLPTDKVTTEISVKKIWDDNENAEGRRPDSVGVNLIAENSVFRTAVLTPENNWEYTFTQVPSDLFYTVSEFPVDGYAALYGGNAKDGFTVTNIPISSGEESEPPPDISSPDTPDAESDTENAGKALIPQTGVNMLPVYFLMGFGTLLVLIGIIDTLRGREKNE